MTSLSLTRELIVPGSDRGTSPLTGVSTPAGTSTLKAEVGRRKRSLSRGAAQRGISTDAVARFRQPTAFQRRPRHSLHRPPGCRLLRRARCRDGLVATIAMMEMRSISRRRAHRGSPDPTASATSWNRLECSTLVRLTRRTRAPSCRPRCATRRPSPRRPSRLGETARGPASGSCEHRTEAQS